MTHQPNLAADIRSRINIKRKKSLQNVQKPLDNHSDLVYDLTVDTKCILKEGGIYVQRNHLRGRIIAMYGTVKNFAMVVKWSNRKAYEIVNGKQEPTAKDIDVMCTALDVAIPEELRNLFFQ